MGNITETTLFEEMQRDSERNQFIDELTMASYETEIDLDRDVPTEDEWLESQAGVYFEGMGWRDIEGQA